MADVVAERAFPDGRVLRVCHGDLTEEAVDAIVNAANEHLAHGGGVAGAIVRRGGPEIQRASDAWVRANGPAAHDRPALTGAGRLSCRAVIHAVGPVWGSGDEDRKLVTAYTAALELAEDQRFGSIAFPSISTGIFGFPVERAAPLAVGAVAKFWSTDRRTFVTEVHFTIIDRPTVDAFERALGVI
ncbi:MAG: macro domain-containing protein [Candidatus Rokubacteria bacterium]|nr:macro domain-containing protein [Candidatus Rokubacteria bacterium]